MFRKFLPFQGPRVYKFRDPDVRTKLYEASTMPGLLALIKGYRAQNELPPIEYLDTVVENFLCGLPEHTGACGPAKPLKRGLIPTLKGGIALITNMLYSRFASQEVADARGAICVQCPGNIFPDKDDFVKWSDDLAEQSVGKLRSAHHDQLGNCAVCTCPLRAKVFWDGEFKFTPRQMKKFPDFCWQKAEALKTK